MKKLFRQPLVHFLVVGTLLFVGWRATASRADSGSDEIVVTSSQIEQLSSGFRMTWQRPPTEAELAGLIGDHLKEEVYYREALALGFDRDDQIIRRRLRQKMQFLTEDVASAVEPTRAELQTFLDENPDMFRLEPRITFQHIYFSVDRRGEDAPTDAARFRDSLRDQGGNVDPSSVGDPFVLPHAYVEARTTEVAGDFGGRFATSVEALPVGEWEGPVESGYGLHLVRVDARVDGRAPALDEVNDLVRRELLTRRRQEAEEAVFGALRDRYTVSVEWPEGMEPLEVEGVGR
jgi:hypothetical protein